MPFSGLLKPARNFNQNAHEKCKKRIPNASRVDRGKRGEKGVGERRWRRGGAVWTAAIWGYA